MPVMMEKLYDALRAADVPDVQARAGAVEPAEYDQRLTALDARMITLGGRMDALEGRMAGVEMRMAALEGRLTTLMWAVGINVAVTLAILAKLLTLH